MSAGTRPPKSQVTMAVFFTVSPSGAMLRTVCVLGRELVDATRCNRGGTRAAAWIVACKRSAMRNIMQDSLSRSDLRKAQMTTELSHWICATNQARRNTTCPDRY